MNYAALKKFDIANGEGIRTTLFVSGCRNRCKGCFQPETWSFDYGEPFTEKVADDIFKTLENSSVRGVTILGGEPMEPENQEAILPLLREMKKRYPQKTVWLFTGNLYEELTGQLGDVMKESAEIAISYIRENAVRLGIDPEFHSKNDIHIHVPEGAVPKDGPSAGVTLATALISVLSSRPVRRDVAMTGEITLRGNVLPIGGLKEKTIAGYSAGVSTILIPKKNVKDLEEIDPVVRENVEFIACETIDDVLNASFSSTDGEIVTAFISKCTSYKA